VKQCPVDMSYLLFAWQDDSPDTSYYLDVESGAVEIVQRDLTDLRELTDRIEQDRHQYLFVPKPDRTRAKKVLKAFIETVEDEGLARILPLAFEAPDPFSSCKSVLAKSPDELRRWEEYRVGWIRSEVDEWLAANFIEVVEAGADIDCRPAENSNGDD